MPNPGCGGGRGDYQAYGRKESERRGRVTENESWEKPLFWSAKVQLWPHAPYVRDFSVLCPGQD